MGVFLWASTLVKFVVVNRVVSGHQIGGPEQRKTEIGDFHDCRLGMFRTGAIF